MARHAVRPTVLLAAAAVLAAGAVALAACSTGAGGTAGGPGAGSSAGRPGAGASAASTSAGALGAGFADPDEPPAPEATIHPEPGSWSGVHPPEGYEVVLLADAGDTTEDAPTRTLVRAVESWAADEHVDVTRVTAADPDDRIGAVLRAVDARPDLVISVGDHMVDPLAAVSPSALHQQFLVVGAEIAEPTSNVTAADWTGAGFRGEGLGASSHHDPSTFTEDRAGRALRAGAAAVLHDLRGIVVWVR